ncbi:MAG TPA: MFS transporter [Candidatus Binataceae bacterium]|nr:MFS transporter [Candidatus Binataceae bacterium]
MESLLTQRQTRQWLVVASLLIAMILVAGPTFGVYGVFFTPLLKEFHLTRAQVSTLSGTLFLAMGLSAPIIGWLLDRIEAKLVAIGGLLISVAGFILAGKSHAMSTLLIAHMLMGIGVNAACSITTPYVVANWFGAGRGTALGVAFVGLALGPMAMTVTANHLVSAVGWRDGYFILTIPMLAIALPLQLAFISSRPPWEVEPAAGAMAHRGTVAQGEEALALPGLEVGEALASRSFWLIVMTNFFFAFATISLSVHIIPYLISIGFAPASAALALGITFGFSSPGNIFFGWLGDKVRSRVALSASLASIAIAVVLLMGASQAAVLAAFVVIYGIAHQGPAFMVPLTVADSLGLRRFGSLSGLIGLITTLGGSLGPIAAGRLFDSTGSYTAPLIMFVISLAISAVLPIGCVPFAEQGTAGEPHALAPAARPAAREPGRT